jgi:WD40 repeat protein
MKTILSRTLPQSARLGLFVRRVHSALAGCRHGLSTVLTMLFLLAATIAAQGQDSRLLVGSVNDGGIRAFDMATGAFLGDFISPGSGGLVMPAKMLLGPDGRLYVADCAPSHRNVKRYTTSGQYIDDFLPVGSGSCYGMAFGPDGNFYAVSILAVPATIRRYDGVTGAFMDEFVPGGSGGLSYPISIVFGPDGRLYAGDNSDGVIRRYDASTGAFVDAFAQTTPTFGPSGIVISGGTLYVVGFGGAQIRGFDLATGTLVASFGVGPWPVDLVMGPDGTFYTNLRYSSAVQNLDATGVVVRTLSAGIGETFGLLRLEANLPPLAVAGNNQSVRPGTLVHLNGGGSSDDNTPTSSLSYAWSFESRPGGSAATLSGAHTMTPTFTPDVLGSYVVRLVVTDPGGLSSPPSSVTVGQNTPPMTNAGLDQLVIVGSTVSLAGSASDAEGDPLSTTWTFTSMPGGSTASFDDARLLSTTFVPDRAGTYTASLVASDVLGEGVPDEVQVTATTASTYAQTKVQAAAAIVVALPLSAVTNAGNQNTLAQFLAIVATVLDSSHPEAAIQKLQMTMTRVDGCALRGVPDGHGPDRDWVTSCGAQAQIYAPLQDALAALTP